MPVAVTPPRDSQSRRPRIAATMGDPSGVGPELVAKLLNNIANRQRADIILLADYSELKSGFADAGISGFAPSACFADRPGLQILDDGTSSQYQFKRGEISKGSGARSMHQLRRALEMAHAGDVDGIMFAPLNKSSLKLAGMTEEDELRWFANQMNYHGTTSEINIAGPLWTARVTSHISLAEVSERVTKESTLKAIELLHTMRWESGIESPRIGVCALNPHNGENGAFGRQEIDHIRPAIEAALKNGIDARGPYPCDTIFLKRQHFDGIVTMFHDQGQIAMKLLSFEGGVTVQGGLPIPISTPAHGTAFDIVGKGMAEVTSTQNAFDIVVTMAERRMHSKNQHHSGIVEAGPAKTKPLTNLREPFSMSCC